jgi:hypothetical protein
MKCLVSDAVHVGVAAAAATLRLAAISAISVRNIDSPQFRREANKGSRAFKPLISSSFSKEAVGVDIDADPDFGAPLDLGQPIADDVLDVEASAGVDEQALAMAAAEHR